MTENKIFPTKLAEKNDYYTRCIPYCDTNKVRLMIDATKIGNQVTNLTNWNGVYPDSVNKNLTTKTLRDERDLLIPVIENGLREIYKDIPQSKLTEADRNTLNLKKPDTIKTPRAKITDVPFVKITAKEGALMDFTCRTTSDSTRASIHKDADGIEFVYNIGGPPPISAKDCTKNFFSSRAKFTKQFDNADAGKMLYCFARWKNSSDESKSGPWIFISAMISG